MAPSKGHGGGVWRAHKAGVTDPCRQQHRKHAAGVQAPNLWLDVRRACRKEGGVMCPRWVV